MIKEYFTWEYMRSLPARILALITGEIRHLPTLDFNWKGNVVHSLLMCYYAIFWRRRGIRSGGLTWYQDSTGKRKVWVTTWFGALQFLEHEIVRPAFRWKLAWKEVKIFVPTFAIAGIGSPQEFINLKTPYLFAIAFAEAEGAATGTSTSPQIANVEGSGADRWLGVHLNFGAASVSAVPVFGGSNTTIIAANVSTGDGNPNISSYRLIAPSTTSGNLDATLSASVFWTFLATTYTGVDQTTSTADEDSNAGGPYNIGSPVTLSNTSDLNGSWQFLSAKEDSAGTSYTVDAPAQLRQGEDGAPINMLADGATEINASSNGSITVNWTGGAQKMGYQSCMIRPSVAAGPANVKTVNDLAKASVKTVKDLAIASVKTINDLA